MRASGMLVCGALTLLGVAAPPAALAAWPGDNGELAYVEEPPNEDSEITLLNGVDLTSNTFDDRTPTWSPDGEKIAFVRRFSNPDQDIYVMDADGTNEVPLVTDAANNFDPTWSPGGSCIAFSSTRNGLVDLYAVRSDGSEPPVRLTTDAVVEMNPAWSPDGSTIAFEQRGDNLIAALDVETGDTEPLTPAGVGDYEPTWSPDGAKIAFRREAGNGEIFTMNADGSGEDNVTEHGSPDSNPAFSPAGDYVYWSSNRDGSAEIFRSEVTGANVAQLTDLDSNPPTSTQPDQQPTNTTALDPDPELCTPPEEPDPPVEPVDDTGDGDIPPPPPPPGPAATPPAPPVTTPAFRTPITTPPTALVRGVTVPSRVRLRQVLTRGITVSAGCGAQACRMSGELQIGGPLARRLGLTRSRRAKTVTIARGAASAAANKKASIRLRFTSTAKRRLRRNRRTLGARLVLTPSSGGREGQKTIRSIRLRR